jgi:hypothetical protein
VGSSPTPPLEIRGKITPHKWAINVKREYTHHSIYLFFLFLWFLISVCYRKISVFLSDQKKTIIAAGSRAESARKSDIVMASELPFEVRFQAEQPIADDTY